MTFADKKLRRLLKKRFISAWIDTTGDPTAGTSFQHDPKEPAGSCIRGNGEHNVQMIVLTPEGRIFHVVSGYIGADDLREELAFALEQFGHFGSNGKKLAAAHRGFAETLQARDFSGPLGNWEKRRAIADHEFVAKHPLLAVEDFEPEMLVGNAKTFFGSRNGTARATAGR